MDIKIPIITQPLPVSALKNTQTVNPVNTIVPVAAIQPQNLSAAENQQQMLNVALRQLLAQQSPPTLLLTQLHQALPTLQHNGQLSPDLKALLAPLIQSLPQVSTLNNPQLLAAALQNAGLFLEAKMLQSLDRAEPQLQKDFKANLLKLKAALQLQLQPEKDGNLSADEIKTLDALQENIIGALNKLQVDQLASLPKEDSPKQQWFVEIPFMSPHGTGSLALEVERDAGRATETDQEPDWSVTLTLTPPGLATLYCKMSLVGDVLNTYFRSEDMQTLTLINDNIKRLRTRFGEVGLTLGYLDAQKGKMAKDLSNKLHRQTIFDDRA